MPEDKSRQAWLDRQNSMDRAGYTEYCMRDSMGNLFVDPAVKEIQNKVALTGQTQTVYSGQVRPTQ
jgi:hypothetical protein